MKRTKFRTRFILVMPNGREMLVISNSSWAGLTDYVKYFNPEHYNNIAIKPISFLQSVKFLFKHIFVKK